VQGQILRSFALEERHEWMKAMAGSSYHFLAFVINAFLQILETSFIHLVDKMPSMYRAFALESIDLIALLLWDLVLLAIGHHA
jgi:hypothetical protein